MQQGMPKGKKKPLLLPLKGTKKPVKKITEDEIDYLIDSSYTEEEIEELISYPFLLRECIDYAYCDDY